MNKLTLPVGLLAAAASVSAQTSISGTYTFGSGGNVSSFAYNGTDIANLTEGSLDKVGVATTSSSGNFRATGWALDIVSGSLTGSLDTSKYFELSLSAAADYELSMTSLSFGLGRSGTGPRSFAWRSSADGYAANIADYTIPSGISGSVSQSSGVLTLTDNSLTTLTGISLNLSAAAFQDLSTITFRLYGWNAEATAGTAGLQGPLTFSGSLLNVAPVVGGPYWSAVAGGGGSGTWSSDGTNWATDPGGVGSGQTQGNVPLVFADAAGTVTVSGEVAVVQGFSFRTTGYALEGGAIRLAGTSAPNNALVTDAGVSATLSSVLAGSAGMTKDGAGTLVLSGANTFAGNAVISAGVLQISADDALGAAANDLVNNGTLRTTANLALGAGRDVSGNGAYDIAAATTLTLGGNVSASGVALANTGTLSLQGATRSLGVLSFSAAGTLDAAGAVNATGLTAAGVTSGTARVNPDIVFTSGDKTVGVGSGGTLELVGSLSNGGVASRILKVGAGTLVLSGANLMGGLRVGAAGATPTDGGTVVLGNSSVGTQAQAIQLNYGTLSAATNLVMASGVTLGGRSNGLSRLAGGDMTFQGVSSFFRGTGTSGELRLDVDNRTTFAGGLGTTTGGGSATGVTIGGTGELVIGGDALAFVDNLTLTNRVKLTLDGQLGSGVVVGFGATIGGTGLAQGSLHIASGGYYQFSPGKTLTVNGASVSFGGFGVSDLLGLSSSTPLGSYTLINGVTSISFANVFNVDRANYYDLGGGKHAYFVNDGNLTLRVVAEYGRFWGNDQSLWSSTGSTWATAANSAGLGNQDVAGTLVFGNAAAQAITVSGTVSAGAGITFSTDGHSIAGGTKIILSESKGTFTDNSITVNGGLSASIGTVLDGIGGMCKAGAGTLVLTGSNTLMGGVWIAAGTLQISADNALGSAANALENNGTLRTVASLSLGSGRRLSGNGTYDIAPGTTLTVNGDFDVEYLDTTTLANTGTLSVQGAIRSLGHIAFAAAGTLDAAGAIRAIGLTAAGLASGTARVNPDIVFSPFDQTVGVGSGGTLELAGSLSNSSGAYRMIKVGAGTLVLSGASSMGGLRIGAAGAAPTDGGIVVLGNSSVGTQAQAIQLDYGILSASSDLTLATGMRLAGRTGAEARLSGSDLEVTGPVSFFRAAGTAGALVLRVDNTTTFSGGIGATTGAGAATGVILGGSGELILSGDSSAFLETLELDDTIQLTLDGTLGGGVNVGASGILGGGGTIGGSLYFAPGSKFILNLMQTLRVNGASVSFGGFDMSDLVGLDSGTPVGSYTLIDGLATFNMANLGNFGAANAFSLGGGKSAYFTEGSLILNVVPEPSTHGLALGGLALALAALRRRRGR